MKNTHRKSQDAAQRRVTMRQPHATPRGMRLADDVGCGRVGRLAAVIGTTTSEQNSPHRVSDGSGREAAGGRYC